MSCLQLGFYLASWGMLRGSSTLLRKSARHYEPVIDVIDVIAAAPAEVWDVDADRYSIGTWPVIRQLDQQIRHAFGHDNGVTRSASFRRFPRCWNPGPALAGITDRVHRPRESRDPALHSVGPFI